MNLILYRVINKVKFRTHRHSHNFGFDEAEKGDFPWNLTNLHQNIYRIESSQQYKIQFGVKITEKMALILYNKHMTKDCLYCIVWFIIQIHKFMLCLSSKQRHPKCARRYFKKLCALRMCLFHSRRDTAEWCLGRTATVQPISFCLLMKMFGNPTLALILRKLY